MINALWACKLLLYMYISLVPRLPQASAKSWDKGLGMRLHTHLYASCSPGTDPHYSVSGTTADATEAETVPRAGGRGREPEWNKAQHCRGPSGVYVW